MIHCQGGIVSPNRIAQNLMELTTVRILVHDIQMWSLAQHVQVLVETRRVQDIHLRDFPHVDEISRKSDRQASSHPEWYTNAAQNASSNEAQGREGSQPPYELSSLQSIYNDIYTSNVRSPRLSAVMKPAENYLDRRDGRYGEQHFKPGSWQAPNLYNDKVVDHEPRLMSPLILPPRPQTHGLAHAVPGCRYGSKEADFSALRASERHVSDIYGQINEASPSRTRFGRGGAWENAASHRGVSSIDLATRDDRMSDIEQIEAGAFNNLSTVNTQDGDLSVNECSRESLQTRKWGTCDVIEHATASSHHEAGRKTFDNFWRSFKLY
ncbi:hypothetical protein CAC42_3976 [Sphaceloma murrayae]|uniref:Uncharacterized protein n=1 Tax=Sphaceloma murrayae TaxID=2082308 RepID=A0A2K1QSG2_9PEZI|nr:hypothetical protein CAC42_3976 [Sphaceloma murrayae]